jgi:hypothetical protein
LRRVSDHSEQSEEEIDISKDEEKKKEDVTVFSKE